MPSNQRLTSRGHVDYCRVASALCTR
ncbi:putative leader peptide [Thermomonospora catenispora]